MMHKEQWGKEQNHSGEELQEAELETVSGGGCSHSESVPEFPSGTVVYAFNRYGLSISVCSHCYQKAGSPPFTGAELDTFVVVGSTSTGHGYEYQIRCERCGTKTTAHENILQKA